MTLIEFRLDRRGVREILQSEDMRRLVDGAAHDIAARVRARVPAGTRVEVTDYTTDRAGAAVTIVDVRGMSWQARNGVLTRAAGELGIEVRDWRG